MRAFRAALLSLLLGASGLAYGEGERPGSQLAAPSLVQAAIQEKDVALLLDYLRAAIRAAAEGREPPPPPSQLERRMDELGSEIKARGTLAALVLEVCLQVRGRSPANCCRSMANQLVTVRQRVNVLDVWRCWRTLH